MKRVYMETMHVHWKMTKLVVNWNSNEEDIDQVNLNSNEEDMAQQRLTNSSKLI